jgi:hypothetical protein
MPLVIDPDQLSQGASQACAGVTFTVGSPLDEVVMTATATLPVLTAGEFFEVRDHSVGNNNGLYQEVGGSPTTSSITAKKISGSNPTTAASEAITRCHRASQVFIPERRMERRQHVDPIYLSDGGNHARAI